MANMSSFYGGRSAPSFTIVKNFDGVDVPSNKYTKTFYAIDDKNKLIHGVLSFWQGQNTDPESIVRVGTGDNPECIIRKTRNNFVQYSWRLTENNGTKVDEIQLPRILAKGMFQCFSEGVTTLDEVNYQEYVLIDTVTNLNEYSNPDNGKIYRRGFDVNNGMHGAEYIGRIIGPQGYNTGIQLDTFSNIDNDTSNQKVKGTVIADLLPGSNLVIENNQLKEGQGIECIYANVLDEGGNILQTKIGFKFPYLVNTFKAKQISPYDISEDENLITEIKENGEDLKNFSDNPNPFYRHWSIKIPHGKKGKSIEEIRVQPTVIPANTPYYNNLEILQGDIRDNNNYEHNNGLISEKTSIPSDAYDKSNYCIVLKEGTETEPIYKYIDAKLCTNKKVFYTTRDYDSLEKGSVSIPFEVGDINSIIKTNLADDGTLTIYYDNGEEEIAKNRINFIKEVYIGTADDATKNNKVKPNCLYVRYSDPDYFLREEDYIEINGKKWVELGILTPSIEGQKFIATYDKLPDDKLHTPPEVMTGSITGYGGLILVSGIIYIFDYLTNTWKNSKVSIGTVEDAGKIVSISAQEGSPNLTGSLPNSIRFGTNQIKAR